MKYQEEMDFVRKRVQYTKNYLMSIIEKLTTLGVPNLDQSLDDILFVSQ